MKQRLKSILVLLLFGLVLGFLFYVDFLAQDNVLDENWVEFEKSLAIAFFPEDMFLKKYILCEWEVIDKDKNTMYVWAICQTLTGATLSSPAVVRLEGNNLEVERPGTIDYSNRVKELFPPGVYEKIRERDFTFPSIEHLENRRKTPGPPLIAQQKTPTTNVATNFASVQTTISTPLPYPHLVSETIEGLYPLPKSSLQITKSTLTFDQMRVMTLGPEEIATQVQPYIERRATEVQAYKDAADITLDNIGQTFTYTIETHFFVFLDDDKYPIHQLKFECEPEPIMLWLSNGSFRGPNHYPIYYAAMKIGKCILRNGDFYVNFVVVQRTPVAPLRTLLPTNTPSNP